MVTRIWHGATPAAKSDEYLSLMRTVALPDYRSTPGNKGAYALRRVEGDTLHFLMITFWESEEAIQAFAGDNISVAKYYDFDSKRVSNPPSQAAEPVVKCGYGSSDERSHGKTTDTGRDSADCFGVCNERHATE
jgi:heme-degrading monooxygenase HmoA